MNYKKLVFFNTVGNITYLFVLWLLTVVVTRTVGYEAAGIFTLAMSVGNVFSQIQSYGMQSFQVSDVTGEYSKNQYIYSRYITVGLGIAGCALYCLGGGYSWKKTAAIMFYLLFRSSEAMSSSYFSELQKVGRLDILAKSMLAKSGLMLGIFTAVLYLTGKLTLALLGIAVLSAAITVVYDRPRCYALVEIPRERVTLRAAMEPLRRCFPLMIATLIPILVTAMPRVLLDRYNGEELLGYFGNVSAPTVLIQATVPTVLIPVMTWYGELVQKGNWGMVAKGMALSMAGCAAFGLLACAAVWLVGDWVMGLVFTEKIVPYVHYMYPLIWATVLNAGVSCVNSVLIAVRRNGLVMAFSVVSLVVAAAVCVPLVKGYAIPGAIAVLAIAYFMQLALATVGAAVIIYRKKHAARAE